MKDSLVRMKAAYWATGALGGFAATYLQYGCLVLPSLSEGKLYLGFLGGIVLGALAGWYGNTSKTNAFMWGLGGTGALKALMQAVPQSQLEHCAHVITRTITSFIG